MYKIESKLNFNYFKQFEKKSDSNISNVCFNYFEQLVT